MKKEIKVSVYCLAYNHEKYIRNTLEGFVNQKTNFDFEVLVHEDASTDSTKDIIQEYAEKYPDIIRPIYQTENQYSKKIKIVENYILPRMNGEYIAVCEGDDYWCDDNKLQKQVDFLDHNPVYSACVHNTLILDLYRNQERRLNDSKEEYDLSIEHVLLDGGVDFHTSSLMYRMEHGKIIHSKERPEFFNKAKRVGDYPKAIYLALKGKIRYFPEVMSVYRLGTPGSWTRRVEKHSVLLETQYSIVEMLKSVDEYTDFALHSVIEPIIENRLLKILDKETSIKVLKSQEIRYVLRKQKLSKRLKIYIKLLYLNKTRYK